MCGVFGIYGHPEAANLTYLGLHALQHRGQESAGIVTSDSNQLYSDRGMGHVIDVCPPDHIARLKGGNAIGHVSTISPLSEGPNKPAPAPGKDSDEAKPTKLRRDRFNGATLITLHEAVPARGLLALIKTLNAETAKAPTPSGESAPEKPAP